MTAYVILPHKERFSVRGAGAVALTVADLLRVSSCKTQTRVLGSPTAEPFAPEAFIPVIAEPHWWQSRTEAFLQGCFRALPADPEYLEVHNRASVCLRMRRRYPRARLTLWLHNDPLSMSGLRTRRQRSAMLQTADRIVCVSEWVRDRYLQGLTDESRRIRIIHNALEMPERVPAKEPQIIFVGRMIPEKGALLFAQALALALPQLPHVRALMVGGRTSNGEASALTAYERRIADTLMTIGAQVRHAGFLSHAQTMDAVARSALAVVPSQWDEAFGRTALEAMALGCALIVSERGALPEVAGAAALRLKGSDPAELAALMLQVFREEGLLLQLQQAARVQARRFALSDAARASDALRAGAGFATAEA